MALTIFSGLLLKTKMQLNPSSIAGQFGDLNQIVLTSLCLNSLPVKLELVSTYVVGLS